MLDDDARANYGLWRPVNKKEIQIVRPVMIDGTPHNVGDVVTVREGDAIDMIANGRAKSYPPPPTEEESAEDLAQRRKDALSSGPYSVEITRTCRVRGISCEVGEKVNVGEEDAVCLAISARGKIIGRPPEKEDIREKISRVVEEMLRGASL